MIFQEINPEGFLTDKGKRRRSSLASDQIRCVSFRHELH